MRPCFLIYVAKVIIYSIIRQKQEIGNELFVLPPLQTTPLFQLRVLSSQIPSPSFLVIIEIPKNVASDIPKRQAIIPIGLLSVLSNKHRIVSTNAIRSFFVMVYFY